MRTLTLGAALATAGLLAAAPGAFAAPPDNDAFASPAPLGGAGSTLTGTLTEATNEPGEPLDLPHTVWYALEPAEAGRLAVEIPASRGTHPTLAVYRGAALAELEPVGQSEGLARVAFSVAAGEPIRIAVASDWTGTGSRFTIRVREAPLPRNDAFADARTIRIPGEYPGNLADATTQLGEARDQAHSLWYRIRPRRTGRLTIDVDGPAGSPARLTLYSGERLSALRKVATGRPIRVRARRGREYRLAVHGGSRTLGDFVLSLSDGSIAGKGIALAVEPGQSVAGVRGRGLRLLLTARRQAHVGIDLRVSRRTMRRLGLTSRVLGRASGTVGADESLPVDLRLKRTVRRKLRGVKRLKAVVRLEILRSDAPNRVLTRRVRL